MRYLLLILAVINSIAVLGQPCSLVYEFRNIPGQGSGEKISTQLITQGLKPQFFLVPSINRAFVLVKVSDTFLAQPALSTDFSPLATVDEPQQAIAEQVRRTCGRIAAGLCGFIGGAAILTETLLISSIPRIHSADKFIAIFGANTATAYIAYNAAELLEWILNQYPLKIWGYSRMVSKERVKASEPEFNRILSNFSLDTGAIVFFYSDDSIRHDLVARLQEFNDYVEPFIRIE